jgi:hypothetical protein
LHGELYGLTLLETAEAFSGDGGEMNEHVFTVLAGDESVAFGIVKPLHCSLFHVLLLSFLNSRSRDALSIPERLFASPHAYRPKGRGISPAWKQHTLIEVQFWKVQKIPLAALNAGNCSVFPLSHPASNR